MERVDGATDFVGGLADGQAFVKDELNGLLPDGGGIGGSRHYWNENRQKGNFAVSLSEKSSPKKDGVPGIDTNKLRAVPVNAYLVYAEYDTYYDCRIFITTATPISVQNNAAPNVHRSTMSSYRPPPGASTKYQGGCGH